MEAQECSLSVIGTGSSGNGYILTCGKDKLIIECGMPLERVLERLDYDISGVCGVIVTHAHGDHAKHVPEYAKYFKIYSCRSVADKFGCVDTIKGKTRYMIGAFDVIPLPVPHGDCENYAYYIRHPQCGYFLFCTDAERFPYRTLKPLPDNIIIECNYIHEIILGYMDKGEDIRSDYRSHMEICDTVDAVSRLRGSSLRHVVLIHRSSSNFDRRTACRVFSEELQIDVKVAKNGDYINLGVYDF